MFIVDIVEVSRGSIDEMKIILLYSHTWLHFNVNIIINVRAPNNSEAAGLYVLHILLNNNGASSTTKISFLEPAMLPVSIFEDRFSQLI